MFEEAKKKFEKYGVDVDKALDTLAKAQISVHCWQGDDVIGLQNGGALTGGIQATGNYPGRARSFEELKGDIDFAFSLMPGKKRLNLHAIYGVSEKPVPMDQISIKEFEPWMAWAKEKGVALDFNPTFFSNPMVKDGFTLSSPDEEVRAFWVRHGKACRKIASEFGKRQGSPALCDVWIPDGLKDVPADRLGPRMRLKKSLDEIYSVKYPAEEIMDAVESKVFGIGLESYTVGSSEFYQNYAALNGIYCLMDNGHYHPTENVADKIPSLLCFYPKIALHMTRPVRWDSDHVVIKDDTMQDICNEIVRCDALEKVVMGLDYFDASINRIAAWVIGQRSVEKCLLQALLTPWNTLKELQDNGDFTHLLELEERVKDLPFSEVWSEYLHREGLEEEIMPKIDEYEKTVLKKRG
ncbi:MAG TPA: L-rhamnose isomerase [Firmicutes bacterium]|nr:L-rhamnose isomerase [Bacillota bacterium]